MEDNSQNDHSLQLKEQINSKRHEYKHQDTPVQLSEEENEEAKLHQKQANSVKEFYFGSDQQETKNGSNNANHSKTNGKVDSQTHQNNPQANSHRQVQSNIRTNESLFEKEEIKAGQERYQNQLSQKHESHKSMDFLKALGDASSQSNRQIKLNKKTRHDSEFTESELSNSERQIPLRLKKTFISDVSQEQKPNTSANAAINKVEKSLKKTQAHVTIVLLVNPRSGDCLGKKFLEDYSREHTRLVCLENKVIACKMQIYDLTSKEDKKKYIAFFNNNLPQASNSNQVICAIMGGDGTLGQCLKELRMNPIIDEHINKLTFAALPFGTGNDTGQVFGWGADPGPWAEDIDTLINCLIGAYKDQLTLWRVTVDGDIFTPFDEALKEKSLPMCCYFNIGIDAEIGATVERNRRRSKCMNSLIYILVGAMKIFDCRRHGDRQIKQYVNHVKYAPVNRRQKVLTDLKQVHCEPLNLCGMNLTQMIGGQVPQGFWAQRKDEKLFDREKILRKSGLDVLGWDTETQTSGDDQEQIIQRYDDDKIEMMGAQDMLHFSTLNFSRFGQAKSPFHIDFRDDVDEEKEIFLAIDGEYYKLKNIVKIEFQVDSHMPKIKMLRFNPETIIS
eukprot:403371505